MRCPNCDPSFACWNEADTNAECVKHPMTPELRFAVAEMLRQDGLYVMTMPNMPDAIIPLIVRRGVIMSLKVDCAIRPERFRDGARLNGPVWKYGK